MTGEGIVEAIHLAPGPRPTPMAATTEVEAVAGRGLRGDRYFAEEGTYSTREDLPPPADATFIEAEALAAAARDYGVDLEPGAHRRNVTTRGVALNHLVGEEFRVGGPASRGWGSASRAPRWRRLPARRASSRR